MIDTAPSNSKSWIELSISIALLLLLGLVAKPSPDSLAGFKTNLRGSDDEGNRGVPLEEWDTLQATYPTGRFDSNWIAHAEAQDALLKLAFPIGMRNHAKNAGLASDRFTYLGPQPLASGGFQYTGRVSDIVVSPTPQNPTDPNSHWALAATSGGIWRSDNCCYAGTTWSNTTDAVASRASSFGTLALDPNNANTVYAGTGDLRFGTYKFSSDGLLKSTDAGRSWKTIGQAVFTAPYPNEFSAYPQRQAIGKIAVDPGDSNRLVVGTKTGLYFSNDGGLGFVGPCHTNAFAPPANNRQRQDVTGMITHRRNGITELIAAIGTRGKATPIQPDLDLNGANGLYRAIWNGSGCPSQWQLISREDNGWPAGTGNGNAFGPLGRIELAQSRDGSTWYAMVTHPQDFTILGIWQSKDFGATWLKGNAVVSNAGSNNDCGTGTQNWYNSGISTFPNQPDHLVTSNWWVGISRDGGNTLTSTGCSNGNAPYHIDQHARAFVQNDPNRLLIGNDGGLYYSGNFNEGSPTFQSMIEGLGAIEFYSGDISPNFANATLRTLIGGAQDNGTSVLIQNGPSQASVWERIRGGDGIAAKIEPILQQRVYFSNQNGRIFLSTNGANAAELNAHGIWATTLDSTEPKVFLTAFDLFRFGSTSVANSGCSATQGCTHLIYGSNRVWESTNGGIGAETDRFTAISENLTKNTLIVGTDNRSVINTLSYSFTSKEIAVVGTMDGNFWYGFDLGLRPATNSTWVNLTDGNRVLPNRSITKVITDPNNALIAYATLHGFAQNTPTTPGNVYQVKCTARCASFVWRNVHGNLPDIPAQSVMVNPRNSKQVFVGTEWGLYFTDNIEAAYPIWSRFEGFPRVMVWDLQVDRGFTALAAFTRARGAWVWPLPSAITQANLTGVWYQPNESGWGMTITHQNDLLFPIWYTYDASGRPAWLIVSGARQQTDGSYAGPLYRVTGTPFAQINGNTASQGTSEVGSARFKLQNDDTLQFDYSVDGVTQSKTISRLLIPPMPGCRFTTQSRNQAFNASDIWWNPNESGWGAQFQQSGDFIFMTWYTYRQDGSAMWVTGSLTKGVDGRFTGPLNRPTAGTPLAQINGSNATAFPVPQVGTTSLSFSDGEHAQLQYTLDGMSQTKSLERFVFAPQPLSVCD